MKKRIVIMLLALSAALLFAACGGSDMAPATAPAAAGGGATADSAPAPAEAADFAMETAEAPARAQTGAAMQAPASEASWLAEEAESDYFSLPILAPDEAGDRRLVYTVALRLQTSEFLPGMRTLLNTVGEMNGYLIYAEVWGDDLRRPQGARSGEFRLRIPTENLAEFIFVVENNYNIWALRQDMWDDTARYQQTAWGIDDLREEESRLQDALERATGDALIEILDRLDTVQRTIRSMEAERTTMMHNVIYSTIDVQLFEAFPPEDSGPRTVPERLIAAILGVAILVVVAIVVIAKKTSSKGDEEIKGNSCN